MPTSSSQEFTSALDAFLGMKAFGRTFCTIHREMGVNDVVFSKVLIDLSLSYIRFRLVDVSETIRSIVLQIADDPDVLLATVVDPEIYFTFDTALPEGEEEPRKISMLIGWDDETQLSTVEFSSKTGERYFGMLDFAARTGTMFQQNILIPGSEPIFKLTGTPYMKTGA